MIKHFDNTIYWWNQEGEPIKKVMLGGYRVFQLLTDTNPQKVYYRWVNLDPSTDFECVGVNKCYKQKKQQSYDQITWTDVIPSVYRAGDVYEYNSYDCGYVPPPEPIYRWVNLDPSEYYYCSGTTKMYKQQHQVSFDDGENWQNVVPAEYRMGGSAQTQSTDCGYIPPQYRDVSGTPYCNNFDKTIDVEHQISYDYGETWITTATTSVVIEYNSRDCGYVESKLTAINFNGETKKLECDSSRSIKQSDVENILSGSGWSKSSVRYIEVGGLDCVDKISTHSFSNITKLCNIHIGQYITTIDALAFEDSTRNITFEEGLISIGNEAFLGTDYNSYTMTLPSTVSNIGDFAFASNAINTIILPRVEPPTITRTTFSKVNGGKYNIVKVPCESLFKYQRKWLTYTNGDRLVDSIYPIENECWDSSGKKCTFTYQYDATPVYASGSVYNDNVTILDGYQIDKIAKPSTHTHFSYNSINITNKPLAVINVAFAEVTIAPDNRINEIASSFNGSTFENDEFPTLPNIQTISNSFRQCAFTSITLSDTITTINSGAFNYCPNLTSLTLGSGITTIGLDTIEYCTSLSTITCKAVVPPTLGAYALNGAPIDVIYVPAESVDAYKAANRWNTWADKIQAMP